MESSEIIRLVIEVLLVVVIIIMGGYATKAKKEVKELIDACKDALADKKITSAELENILKEAKDVSGIVFAIAEIVARRLARKPKP